MDLFRQSTGFVTDSDEPAKLKIGRFAPSPTGALHLGNLRTAVAAQMFASDGCIIRMEDLDRVNSSHESAKQQLVDLRAIGIESDIGVVFQSERFSLYRQYLDSLDSQGLTYECFCTRREIRESASAPHGEFNRYPGTCRNLSTAERAQRRSSRRPAIRLRADDDVRCSGSVDDIVLERNDGIPSYNLAVVVDDEVQGVTQVVRGRDLEAVTPSQQYLGSLLGFRRLEYIHVGLVVDRGGNRLAKRHFAPTLHDWRALGRSPLDLRHLLVASLSSSDVTRDVVVDDFFRG